MKFLQGRFGHSPFAAHDLPAQKTFQQPPPHCADVDIQPSGRFNGRKLLLLFYAPETATSEPFHGASPAGLEPALSGLEGRCLIQLGYED